MVNQYPHTITVTAQSGEAAVDGDGNPVEGANSSLSLNGRWEVAKGNALVTTGTGTQAVYSGILFLPLPFTAVVLGSEVSVADGASVIAQGIVKQVSKGLFNWRIWL